ncbi:MAG: helix-turn-helix domain-containing protein [Clostridiales bacterium]|nr:helix-turn-helix domain-containing protein [Clostridiales bacterium]
MSKSQIAREQDIARSTVYEELKREPSGGWMADG